MNLNPPQDEGPGALPDSIAANASEWVMRLDRGVSPDEQDRFLQWLAADPRHGEAIARLSRTWDTFDRLAGLQSSIEAVPDPDLLVRRGAPASADERSLRGVTRQWLWVPVTLAAGIALMLAFWPELKTTGVPRAPAAAIVADETRLALIKEQTLEDGSIVRLNRGAELAVEFSSGERRVWLRRGEAAFAVAREPARPFVVFAGGIAVRAVGTVFNVRLADRAVDVIVTEGRVVVGRGESAPGADAPLVREGQRAIVPRDFVDGAATVDTLPADDLARRLAWQPRMLTFTDEPLESMLEEFNRHNALRLRIDDPALQSLRLTARFRSDNIRGLLRLLETDFRVHTETQPGGVIVLRQVR